MKWTITTREPRQQICMSEDTAEYLRRATYDRNRVVRPAIEQLVEQIGLQPLLEVVDNTLELGVVRIGPFNRPPSDSEIDQMESELAALIEKGYISTEGTPRNIAKAILRAGYRKASNGQS